MALRLWNTLTRRKEAFTPLDPRNVRLYVCGPTVYDRAHIGNARPVIVFDLLFRLLRLFPGLDKVTISLRDVVAAVAGSLLVLAALWLWQRSHRSP